MNNKLQTTGGAIPTWVKACMVFVMLAAFVGLFAIYEGADVGQSVTNWPEANNMALKRQMAEPVVQVGVAFDVYEVRLKPEFQGAFKYSGLTI